MIYLDTSVALAFLLAEDRCPRDELWQESLVSSRLMEYELWVRIHARRLERTHAEAVRELLSRVALLELSAPVLARILDPFPAPVRTLDAIHLSSALFMRDQGQNISLASYDDRLSAKASALAIPLASF